MSLSSNQKLRLEQLEIPRWVSRDDTNQLVGVDELGDKEVLDQQKILLEKGDKPTIFWILNNVAFVPSEKFIDDLSISINGINTAWQVISGNVDILKQSIIDDYNNPVFIILGNAIKSVELTSNSASITIQLPVEIITDLSLKRLLWNKIRNHFHE